MTCPICGSQTAPGQNFCRSCGSITAGHAGVSVPEGVRPGSPIDTLAPRRNWMLWGFMMTFIGVAIGVTGKMLLHQDFITFVGVLLSVAGMFLTVYPILSPSRRQEYAPAPSLRPDVPTPVEPTMKLPPMNDLDFIPSVTEKTTDLLKNPARPIKNR